MRGTLTGLQIKILLQVLYVVSADQDLCPFLVIHGKFDAAVEPGNHLEDMVDIDE